MMALPGFFLLLLVMFASFIVQIPSCVVFLVQIPNLFLPIVFAFASCFCALLMLYSNVTSLVLLVFSGNGIGNCISLSIVIGKSKSKWPSKYKWQSKCKSKWQSKSNSKWLSKSISNCNSNGNCKCNVRSNSVMCQLLLLICWWLQIPSYFLVLFFFCLLVHFMYDFCCFLVQFPNCPNCVVFPLSLPYGSVTSFSQL